MCRYSRKPKYLFDPKGLRFISTVKLQQRKNDPTYLGRFEDFKLIGFNGDIDDVTRGGVAHNDVRANITDLPIKGLKEEEIIQRS